MTRIPQWPESPGSRILTLVGNPITIDVRARKTASTLARNGYSVIAIGIDDGSNDSFEALDGAAIHRLIPSSDPRISERRIRLSKPEIRDSARFRLERRRARLNLRRRSMTARHQTWRDGQPRWVVHVGGWSAGFTRMLGVSQNQRDRIRRALERYLRRLDGLLRFGPGRLALIVEQRGNQVLQVIYKSVARPSAVFRRRGRWRRDLPELHRYEAALGGVVDALEPDLVHAHDVFHIGLAVRARSRARHRGKNFAVVYDAHEYVPGLPVDPRRRAAYTDLEREYIGDVDAVVTVSDALAHTIGQAYEVSPIVVMNTPDTSTAVDTDPVRSRLGLGDDVPLVAYVGGLAPHRGGDLLLEAISEMEGVHLGLIVGDVGKYTRALLDRASDGGFGDRIHTAPFVPPNAVVSYLRGLDATIIPLSREVANYEGAMPNKLFQSVQAGVPVIVSDNPAMAQFVRTHRVGEVFDGRSSESLRDAITRVLDSRGIYEGPLDDAELLKLCSWEIQSEALLDLYKRLLSDR